MWYNQNKMIGENSYENHYRFIPWRESSDSKI